MSNGTESLTLKYFVVKKFSSDTLRDENILPRTIFTRKYPTVNFSQTTVYLIPAQCHYSVTSVLFYAGFSQGKSYANKLQAIDCMFIPTTKYSCILA